MQTIYLVRHGETEFNRAGRMQGQQDSPLTALGRDQVRRVGRLLRELIPAPDDCAMVVSPPRMLPLVGWLPDRSSVL